MSNLTFAVVVGSLIKSQSPQGIIRNTNSSVIKPYYYLSCCFNQNLAVDSYTTSNNNNVYNDIDYDDEDLEYLPQKAIIIYLNGASHLMYRTIQTPSTLNNYKLLDNVNNHHIASDDCNKLLNEYIVQDKTHEAERLFKKLIIKYRLCEPDVVTYNTMIKGLSKIGNNFTAIALLRLMNGRGGACKPDVVSYNTIIHSLCNDDIVMPAFKLFKEMVFHKTILPNVVTYNSLIRALSRLGRWDEVSSMLKQMGDAKIYPQVKTFNLIVDALCKQGKMDEAEVVFNIMAGGKYPPDIVTYNSLINGYCLRGEMTKAKTVLDSAAFRGVKPNIVTYNNLLNGYYKDWKIDEAIHMYSEVIKQSVEPNSVTNYIMERVLDRFRRRQRCLATCKPIDAEWYISDHVAYSFYLHHLCEGTYELEKALSLYHYMDGTGLNSSISVHNTLMTGASKRGKFDTARRLFYDITVKGLEPDMKTYTVMMSGFCRRGLLTDAKQLFHAIEKWDYPPINDEIVNDLIKVYLKNRPVIEGFMLIKEMDARGFRINVANILIIMDHIIALEPHNGMHKLRRQDLPKEGDDDYPYFADPPAIYSGYKYDFDYETEREIELQRKTLLKRQKRIKNKKKEVYPFLEGMRYERKLVTVAALTKRCHAKLSL